MRLIARTDKNQAEIVEALRKVGAHVRSMHQMGSGFPDLLVGFRGTLMLMEVKMKGRRLNQEEDEFYSEWKPFMVVVYSIEDALKAIGAADV